MKIKESNEPSNSKGGEKGTPSKRGGARPGAGRKRKGTLSTGAKRRATKRLPETPETADAIAAGVAMSPGVLEEGRRLARRALNEQKQQCVQEMSQAGIAPLDVMTTVMLRLLEKALEAQAAGGLLVVMDPLRPVLDDQAKPLYTEEGNQIVKEPTFRVESETALLVACADAANKAAAYVHPKLASVDLTARTETFEEWAAKMAAKHNLRDGGNGNLTQH